MKKLIIIGAGDFGREVSWVAERMNAKANGMLDTYCAPTSPMRRSPTRWTASRRRPGWSAPSAPAGPAAG